MSSFYDDASLVVIPSGYKTSKVYAEKPTDGSGDLAFTRTGDTATRVNSAGLIEKVRTNRVLQSQTFDNASWLKYNATVTANTTTAPDGTTTADSLTDNANNDLHITYQSLALTAGENTISCYAKANTLSHLSIYIYDGANFFSSGIFNVSNGTVSGAGSITAAGNGWYRISFTATIATGSGNVYIALSNGSTISYAGTGQSLYIWGYQAETGVATAYIPTLTAAVSTGPTANVPRLDYTGSTCPRLLLEPQRTNLVTYSEQINNAAWTKSAGGTGIVPVVTANDTTSPDGYQNAEKIVFNSGAGTTGTDQSMIDSVGFSVANGTTYTGSFWARGAVGGEQLAFRHVGGFTKITLTTSWQRYTLTTTAGYTGTGYFTVGIRRGLVEPLNSSATVFIWGAQLEVGAYATSYIPTLAASATRGADACSKTGISSLIGQTEGTFFGEFTFTGISPLMHLFSSVAGSFGNAIYIQTYSTTGISMQVWSGVSAQVAINKTGLTAGQNIKFAAAYKNNDFVFYVNGVQVGTSTSGAVPSGLSQIEVGGYAEAGSPFVWNSSMKQALVFKTRLSNADLAALTA